MAIRQTDSEPSVEESAAESTDESQAAVSRGNQECAETRRPRKSLTQEAPLTATPATRPPQGRARIRDDALRPARQGARAQRAGTGGRTRPGRSRRHPPGTAGAGRIRGRAREAPRPAQPDRARPVLRPHRRRKARHSLHRPDRPARRRLRAEAHRLARARRPAFLRGDTAQSGRPGPPSPHLHQAAPGRPASTTRSSTWTSCRTADRSTLSGEAALIAAVSSARTGRMADVVATIQAEQDRVIRADLPGVLVVQGGPGTGKTVAALHRAAYLLYTHRRTLERRGVLVIGPNATFLRYISQVLPSLGETDVVLHTLGDLFPGVHATDTRDPAAVVKGDERMVRRAAAGGPRPADGAQATTSPSTPTACDDPAAPRGDPARPRPRPLHPQAAQRRAQALRHRAAQRARPGRGAGAQPPASTTRTCPYARDRLWAEPGVIRRARRAVAAAHPGKAAGRPAEVAAGDQVRRRRCLWITRNETRLATSAPPVALDGGGRPAARRGRRAARRRRLGAAGRRAAQLERAQRLRRSTRRRCSTVTGPSPTSAWSTPRPCGLEPRQRPGVLHRRARRRRPHLGLRPRDHRRGAGTVRDGVADGAAAQPGPLHDRGRRRGADRLAGRRRPRGRTC